MLLGVSKDPAGIVCPALSTAVQEKYRLIGESSAESTESDVRSGKHVLHGRVERAGFISAEDPQMVGVGRRGVRRCSPCCRQDQELWLRGRKAPGGWK